MTRPRISIPEPLLRLQQLLLDAGPSGKGLGLSARPLLGYTCPLIPEELPHALGLHPVRITLGSRPAPSPQTLLQSFCCTWVQAFMADAMAGGFGHLRFLIFSCNTCDSMRNLPDLFRRSVQSPAPDRVYSLRLPLHRDGQAAWDLLAEELHLFKGWLEARVERTLKAEDLAESTRLYNRLRAALRAIQARARVGGLGYTELHAAVTAAQVLDRELALALLEAAVAELEALPATEAQASRPDGPRVMLVGGPLDQPDLVSFLDARGAHVVGDDSCSLDHVLQPELDLDPDKPFKDMASRHLRRGVCAVGGQSVGRRLERLLTRVESDRVQGVIFVPFKGCDPQAFDNVLLSRELDARRIPQITLELLPHSGSWGQLTTRLEAFLEMIELGDGLAT